MHDYNYDNYNYDKTKESACIQYLDFNINTWRWLSRILTIPLHKDFPFLPQKMIIDKESKLTFTLHKKNHRCYVRLFQQALNQELIQKIVRRPIKFKQITWLELNIEH